MQRYPWGGTTLALASSGNDLVSRTTLPHRTDSRAAGSRALEERLRMANSPFRGVRPVIILAAVLMAVGVLYLGRDFLVPVALASLLTFLLNPIVRFFERRLSRAVAVLLVAILAFSALGG